jgi:hypothetical protein
VLKPLYLHLCAIAANSSFTVSEPFVIAAVCPSSGEYVSAPGSFTTPEPNLFLPGGLLGLSNTFRFCATVLPVVPVGVVSGFILLVTENLLPPNVVWTSLTPVVATVRAEREQVMDLGHGAGAQSYWFLGVDYTDGSSVNYTQPFNATVGYFSPVVGVTAEPEILANFYERL